jgi:hypothetical protein
VHNGVSRRQLGTDWIRGDRLADLNRWFFSIVSFFILGWIEAG